MRASVSLPAAIVVLGLAACAGEGERLEPATDTAAVKEHMQDHFSRADMVQRAVINGRQEEARDPALWLADHSRAEGMPESWTPYVERFQDRASEIAQAEDLVTAARATGRMLGTCGECHRAAGADLDFAVAEEPPEGLERIPHMQRHAWASGRMWEGLVGASDAIWDAGVEALDEAPLTTEALTGEEELGSIVRATTEAVHSIVDTAAAVESLEAKAEMYGDFLATCARCHQAFGVSPL